MTGITKLMRYIQPYPRNKQNTELHIIFIKEFVDTRHTSIQFIIITKNSFEYPPICFDTGVNYIIFKRILLIVEKAYYMDSIQDSFEKKLCME